MLSTNMGMLIPVEGRIWLPPDTHTAEALLTRLHEFHSANAEALHRGPDFVAKHAAIAAAALIALKEIRTPQPTLASSPPPERSPFIIAGRSQSHSFDIGDLIFEWMLRTIATIAIIPIIAVAIQVIWEKVQQARPIGAASRSLSAVVVARDGPQARQPHHD